MDIRYIQQKREKRFYAHLKPAQKIELAIELSELVYELKRAVKREYEGRTKENYRTVRRGKRT